MKRNRVRKTGSPKPLLTVIALVVIVLLGIGLLIGWDRLHDIWLEQCVIHDMEAQVSIESGKMVKAGTLAEVFGLKIGANLACIDFASKRQEVLRKIPNLREIRIRRQLPDKVSITIEERVPLARLLLRQARKGSKVVDADGVVFHWVPGTQLLPAIREASAPGTTAGHRLGPRGRAALEILDLCRDPEFQELGILEIDLSKTDFLTVTLGEARATAKIAWEGMDELTPASHANLLRQLTHLRDAIRSRVAEGAVIWNATDFSRPGRVWADTKGKL